MNEFQLDCLRSIKLLTMSFFPDTVIQRDIVSMIERLAKEIEQEEIRKKV
jgi:hypothetical protein